MFMKGSWRDEVVLDRYGDVDIITGERWDRQLFKLTLGFNTERVMINTGKYVCRYLGSLDS